MAGLPVQHTLLQGRFRREVDVVLLVVLTVFSAGVTGLENGLARTPPLGYSTWNFYPKVAIDEKTCYKQVDAIVNAGLRDLGFRVFVVDEPCFTGRNASDYLVENNKTWPHGLKAFGDYLHARGMLLGIYTDQGPRTCGGCPASQGYEEKDMELFASWGADYIKVDSCNRPVEPENWAVFRDAILKTGRPIVFSIIAQGQKASWEWGNATGNLWRTTGDIMNNFQGMLRNLDNQEKVAGIEKYAGPGAWNDPDMLVVGTKTCHGGCGLTVAEQITHFSLWSALKAPLLISADVATMNASSLAILKNEEVLAINQDRLGAQARWIKGQLSNALHVGDCSSGSAPQSKWTLTVNNSLVSQSSSECLTVENCDASPGSPLIMYKCFPAGNACHLHNQMWSLKSTAGCGGQLLVSALGGLCAEVSANGAVMQAECNCSKPQQQWIMEGSQLVSNPSSGNKTCLIAPGAAPASYAGDIYAGPLEQGGYAAVLFNRGENSTEITLNFTDLGLPANSECAVRDLWQHRSLGVVTGSYKATVEPHSVVMVTVTP